MTKNTPRATPMARLGINLDPRTCQLLQDLCDLHGMTYTEVVRRSIAVYDFLDQERSQGRMVQSMNVDGSNRKAMILL